MPAKKPSSGKEPQKIGFWHMMRDVLIASMNKGQFPLAMAGLIIVIVLLKMPGAKIGELASQTYANILNGWLLGYALWIVTVVSWFFHSKWQRRVINDEMARISQERSKLQGKAKGKEFPSSGDK